MPGGMPPLTVGRFFGDWRVDPWSLAVIAVLGVGYLAGCARVRALGTPWPGWRIAGFVVVGLGTLGIATMSSLRVYGEVLIWPAALQLTILLTVTPIGIGLGDPFALVSEVLPEGARARWRRILASRPVRVLSLPVLSPLLGVATEFVVFFTGYLGAAERSPAVMNLLEAQLVVTGCLFALPMFGVELLPDWCTQPVRLIAAAADGLIDAIPGIVVMTSSGLVAAGYYGTVVRSWGPSLSWDQTIGGGLMFTVAEVVAVPILAVLFIAWTREDAAHAATTDRRLDEAETLAALNRQVDPDAPVEDLSRPWWERDPGPLADRAGRFGWGEGPPQP